MAECERAGALADEWGRPIGRARVRTARRAEAGVGAGLRKWAASGKGKEEEKAGPPAVWSGPTGF